jgi:Putative Tad-like Flp pilus-assembly
MYLTWRKKLIKKLLRNKSQGQAIILIALAFTGLVCMVGLVSDGGILLINYAALKRSVDASTVAGAQQFRKGYTVTDMDNAVQEFLNLNQTQLNQSPITNIITETCDTAVISNDPALCTTPPRKLVRVTASQQVQFGFLRVIGIKSTTITASSIGEAASIDMVLVVDTSISMTAATSGNLNTIDPGDDPSACNPTNTCQPMALVKQEAQAFADQMFFPYDRVAVVAMTDQVPGDMTSGGRNPITVWHLQSSYNGTSVSIAQAAVIDQANVDNAIAGDGSGGTNSLTGLEVYQPSRCQYEADNKTPAPVPTSGPFVAGDNYLGPCLDYGSGTSTTFVGQNCPIFYQIGDPTTCNSTNGGGAYSLAGTEFSNSGRKNSLWVVVTLLTGAPNSSWPLGTPWTDAASHPNGYCPSAYWSASAPFCIEPKMTVIPPDPNRVAQNNPTSSSYSSLDYARDMADDLADPTTGLGASIYGICLGNRCEHSSTYNGVADATEPEEFLEYAAEQAGGTLANHGNYYLSSSTSDLTGIFQDILNSITTKISQ